MIIVFRRDSYIIPHKHVGKSESFHIIEGKAAVIIFDELGNVERIINMGEYHTGLTTTYRLNDNRWHTVIPMSEILILKEVTSGPFVKSESLVAAWAPDEKDYFATQAYLKKLVQLLDESVFSKIDY